MSKIIILFLLLTFSLAFKTDQNVSKLREVSERIYTTFTCVYPQNNLPARSTISIRGNNCDLTWSSGVLLKKVGNDTWAISLLCPTDEVISVKLLLNNTDWMVGQNHVFTLSSQQLNPNVTIYPSFNPPLNKIVDTAPISSTILKNQRKLSIYYPPSYFQNTYKKYELLLMHDGQNLFDPSKAAFGTAWLCQNTVNQLIFQGKMREIIIVGIWNTNDRMNQYTYSYDATEKFGGKGDLYLDFIQKQLLPKLKAQYFAGRIDGNYGITIGGSSLGGLISCYATYTRPQVFKNAICMSSSFWWNNQDFKNKIIYSKPYNSSTVIYLDSGDSGPSQDGKIGTENAKAGLLGRGYVEKKNLFYYLDIGGQHSQAYWGKRFHVPMTYMFG